MRCSSGNCALITRPGQSAFGVDRPLRVPHETVAALPAWAGSCCQGRHQGAATDTASAELSRHGWCQWAARVYWSAVTAHVLDTSTPEPWVMPQRAELTLEGEAGTCVSTICKLQAARGSCFLIRWQGDRVVPASRSATRCDTAVGTAAVGTAGGYPVNCT